MSTLRIIYAQSTDTTQILKVNNPIPESFLQDESKLREGMPEAVYFPKSTSEISALCKDLSAKGQQITVSGGRSGIVGGSVPVNGCAVVSTEKLEKLFKIETRTEGIFLRVSANQTIREINQYLNENLSGYFYPIDPTYIDAAIGGNISTNAGGSRSVFYGQTREWIQALTVILPDGSILELERGKVFVENNSFSLVEGMTGQSRIFTGHSIRVPKTKNSLGPRFYEGMDLIDLFIGAEGVLGIISETVIKLAPKPQNRWYHMQFFENTERAFKFAEELLGLKQSSFGDLLAVEFIDPDSLLIAQNSIAVKELKLIKNRHQSMVFFDFALKSHDSEGFLNQLEALLEKSDCDAEDSVSGDDQKILDIFKTVRHAVPEQINAKVAKLKLTFPILHKISTDMSVPTSKLQEIYDFYKTVLRQSDIEHYIFGHFGSGHLHLNVVPDTEEKLKYFKENLYIEFARKVVQLGGSVSGEHGIGKLKRWCLNVQFTEEEIQTLVGLKSFFDPRWLLNTGVLVDK